MDPNLLLIAIVQFLILQMALAMREATQATVAAALGDTTARDHGRCSLHPWRHIDPLGSILVPMMLLILNAPPFFGWARPIPLKVEKLRQPFLHHLAVRASGPAANAAFAIFAMVILAVVVRAPIDGIQEAAQLSVYRSWSEAATFGGFPLAFTLVQMVYLNAFLAVFYLVPVPPLDGGQMLLSVMPPDWAVKWNHLRPWGFLIAMSLALFHVLTLAMLPLFFVLTLVINL